MKVPKTLIPGDLISIIAPAKSIDSSFIEYSKAIIEKRGYRVLISKHCLGAYNYYSGTDEERLFDFQEALNNPEVKAILCARGGYGSVKIFENLDWNGFIQHPKWVLGFSDITVFHQLINSIGVQSIHSTMPLNFEENSKAAIDTLFSALNGSLFKVQIPPSKENISGSAKGNLIGGNLSIIYSLLASDYAYDYKNKILFIEDLCEQLYHLDRMMYALKHAGVFKEIKGLIVGGMTEMKDTKVPFGMDSYEIILRHVKELDIPVCFDFPCGHIDDNRAMIIGADAFLLVTDSNAELSYI